MNNTRLKNGQYTIVEKISSGGFGITYKAVRASDNNIVCIKEFYIESICKREPATNSIVPLTEAGTTIFNQYKSNFVKEAQTLRKLNNKYIISVTDVFEERGTAYYVMEFINGTPLSEMVPANGLAPKAALRIIEQLLEAVAYIHQHKITHLDIKPSNIIIRDSGDIVLIDFGGSKRYTEQGEETSSSPLSTSEGYAPIELYEDGGLKDFSPETDIYEIGATLYNLITGEVPPSASAIMDEGNPIESKEIPLHIKQAIQMAMEPGIKKRIKSTTELKSILDNKGRHPQKKQSHKTIYIIVAIALLTAILGYLFYSHQNSSDNPNQIRAELQKFVTKENRKPKSSNTYIQIDSFSLTDTALELNTTIKENNKLLYEEFKKMQKGALMYSIKKDKALTDVCQKLYKAGMNFHFIINLENNPDSRITIKIEASELAALETHKENTPKSEFQQFEEMAKNTTKGCPQAIDDGLTMTKCEFRNKTIEYYYNCTTQYYNYIDNNLDSWKTSLETQFSSNEMLKAFVEICDKSKVNIRYIYQEASSSKKVSITYNTSIKKFI